MNRPLVFSLLVLVAGTTLWGLNEKDAGPAAVELKFRPPPPKPLSAEEELKTFKVAPGFRVELFAAEPMIECPIAMSWDERGRMFVLEMRGYMHDVEGTGEDQPNGIVSVLEDTDGDGKADKRTVFAEGLVLPRALMCVNGGALIAEPPNLFFMKDTDGDGKADVKEVVEAAYGKRGGQPEHMANSPTWMLDNWVYSADHEKRYRLEGGKWRGEAVPSRGQWGWCQDDYGRAFYNFNSDFLRANFVPDVLAKRNPHWTASASVGVQVVKDQATWPIAPTPGVNRGYAPKTLDAEGKLTTCTATCGAAIYRGGLFGAEYAGNAFIPEPSANLVKRFILREKEGAITGENVKKGEEFMASTDERFRPVNAYSGPDGALYLADMYRGVIQHKGFLTHYLVANIKDRKLEQPVNMGRIWRIVPEGAKAQFAKLPTDTAGLVAALGDRNGWVRDTAQRLLVERQDPAALPGLVELAKTGSTLGKIHALWTMEGYGVAAIGASEVVMTALKDGDARVRAAAVWLGDASFIEEMKKLAGDPSFDVRIAVAYAVSARTEAQDTVLTMARQSGANALVRDGLMSGLKGRELEVLGTLVSESDKPAPAGMLRALAAAVMTERSTARIQKLFTLMAAQGANGAEQLAMLDGVASTLPAKNARKPKMLNLKGGALPELAGLVKGAEGKAKPLVELIDSRIVWENKAGYVAPPPVPPLTAGEQKLFDGGKVVYTTLCIACHQASGQGQEGLAPSLIDSDWVLGKEDLIPRIVIHGLSGLIDVNGKAWTLEMPPLGPALSDEQVAGVATYVRREWEHDGSPVSVEMVKKIREENKARTKGWTAQELDMVPKKAGKK